MTIVSEIGKSHTDIVEFLRFELNKIIQSPLKEEILTVHLHPFVRDERYPIVLEKINQILNTSNEKIN